MSWKSITGDWITNYSNQTLKKQIVKTPYDYRTELASHVTSLKVTGSSWYFLSYCLSLYQHTSQHELLFLYFQEHYESKTEKHVKHDFQTNKAHIHVTLKQIY